jgi:tetratricopeptide (TPR) repeat protein
MDRRIAVIALAFGTVAFGDPAYFGVSSGNKLYAEGKYEEALAEYLKAKAADPARSEADYNAGVAQFKTGRFKESAGAFERALEGGKAQLKSPAAYNRSAALYAGGVSAREAGELDEASKMLKASAEGYKAALRERPSDGDIRHNLELALEKLKEIEEQKKKQEKDSHDKGGQDKKEKEKDGAGKNEQSKDDKKPSPSEKKPEQADNDGSGKKQEMTAEEAERALAAVQSDEKDLRKKIRNQNMKERPKSGKDW